MAKIDDIVASLAEQYTLAAKCILFVSLVQHYTELIRSAKDCPGGNPELDANRNRLQARLAKFPDNNVTKDRLHPWIEQNAISSQPSEGLNRFLESLGSHYQPTHSSLFPYRADLGRTRLFLGLPSPFSLYNLTVGSFHELSYEFARRVILTTYGEKGDPEHDQAAGSADEPALDITPATITENNWGDVAARIAALPAISLEKIVLGINEEYQTSKSIEVRRAEAQSSSD